jgi:hypothetical protein
MLVENMDFGAAYWQEDRAFVVDIHWVDIH